MGGYIVASPGRRWKTGLTFRHNQQCLKRTALPQNHWRPAVSTNAVHKLVKQILPSSALTRQVPNPPPRPVPFDAPSDDHVHFTLRWGPSQPSLAPTAPYAYRTAAPHPVHSEGAEGSLVRPSAPRAPAPTAGSGTSSLHTSTPRYTDTHRTAAASAAGWAAVSGAEALATAAWPHTGRQRPGTSAGAAARSTRWGTAWVAAATATGTGAAPGFCFRRVGGVGGHGPLTLSVPSLPPPGPGTPLPRMRCSAKPRRCFGANRHTEGVRSDHWRPTLERQV